MNHRLLSPRLLGVISCQSFQCNKNLLSQKVVYLVENYKVKSKAFSTLDISSKLPFLQAKSLFQQPRVGLKIEAMERLSSDSQFEKDPAAEPHTTSMTKIGEADGWLSIGAYNVFAWSISGVESCIIVKSEDVQIVFDLGIAVKESVRVPNVFITHGHIDHIGGLINHISKRSLFGMKPARYHVPPHLVEPLKTIVQAHHVMAEKSPSAEEVNILPMSEGETVKLNSRFFVKTFPTLHPVPSQGYIVYKEEKVLKEEFKGMEGFEVSALFRAGKEIHDVVLTPEIAYTGDTQIDLFINPPIDDLLRVKLLITEATYLDENDKRGIRMVEKARERGHTHLVEIGRNAHLFENVGHIILVHFSSKYSPKYIYDSIRDKLPYQLRAKLTPATVAASTKPTSYL